MILSFIIFFVDIHYMDLKLINNAISIFLILCEPWLLSIYKNILVVHV